MITIKGSVTINAREPAAAKPGADLFTTLPPAAVTECSHCFDEFRLYGFDETIDGGMVLPGGLLGTTARPWLTNGAPGSANSSA